MTKKDFYILKKQIKNEANRKLVDPLAETEESLKIEEQRINSMNYLDEALDEFKENLKSETEEMREDINDIFEMIDNFVEAPYQITGQPGTGQDGYGNNQMIETRFFEETGTSQDGYA